ncbi:MAG: phosphatase PAP2 family protein [Actinomycetota bacterium]
MRRLGLTLAWGAAAVAVGIVSSTSRGRLLDESAFALVNRDRGPASDALFSAITELGALGAAAGAAATLAVTGHRRAAVRGATAAGAAWLAGQGLKKVWNRPRPYDAAHDSRVLIGRPVATSWPSSHPATLLAFSLTAAHELGLGGVSKAGLGMLSIAVGVSRTHLGVHYPSDVLGGLLLGRAIAEALTTTPPDDIA